MEYWETLSYIKIHFYRKRKKTSITYVNLKNKKNYNILQ